MSEKIECHCQACEVKLFESLKAKVLDLTEEELKTADDFDGRGFALIHELHWEVADRYPLGIGQVLHAVMTSVHIGERGDALNDLDQLIADEVDSAKLNGSKLNEGCKRLEIEAKQAKEAGK